MLSVMFGMLTLLCSCLSAFILFMQATSISHDGRILLRLKNVDWIDRFGHLNDWNSYDQNPCQWQGIECNSFKSVVTVDLTSARIRGNLTSAFCDLANLTALILQDNDFGGLFPDGLLECKRLQVLDLSYNQFAGSLPNRTYELRKLSVSGNNFNGEIPLGLWSASNLQWLSLKNNKFEGQISPAIGQAKNLIYLDLGRNNCSGDIPLGLWSAPNLQWLYLRNNNFQGQIPPQIGQAKNLTILDVSSNNFSGSIPTEVGQLRKLNKLNLAHNQLTGVIPGSLGALYNLLSGKIAFLNLSDNRLSGIVPAAMDNPDFKDCFENNPGLCGGQHLGLPPCSNFDESFNSDESSLSYEPKFKSVSQLSSIVMIPPLILLAALALTLNVVLFRYFRFRRSIAAALSWKLTAFHSSLEFDESYIFRNMKENNIIGYGGSGKVYKLTLRNQQVVAVKKIQNTVGSTRHRRNVQQENHEMEVEVDTLGAIRHRNILKLLCCITSEEADFKLLVYDYMPNGSLYDRLHDVRSPEIALEWPIRYQIAVGAANGLCYMHHDCSPPILHRDVKSNNILLDSDFQPTIADFGLCRLLQNLENSYPVSGYVGSHGYIAPEYASSLKVSSKSDVYSFGVVLLELVSGKKATGEVEFGEGVEIVRWIRSTLWREGGEDGVLDMRVTSCECVEQMKRVLKVGLVCTQRSPKERPSMRVVVEMLRMCNQQTPH